MTFVGNANLFKIFGAQQFLSFPLSFVFGAIYLPMMRLDYKLLKIVLLILFVSYFLFINIYQHLAASFTYVIWPLNCFVLGIFFAEFIKNIEFTDVRPFLVLPMILIAGLLIQGIDQRATFFFGPNVLYRIFLFSGAILLLYSKSGFFKFLGLVVVMFGATTGSRGFIAGATVLFLFYTFIFFGDKKNSLKNKFISIIIVLPILSLLFFNLANERIFFFDPESYSSLSRLDTINLIFSDWHIMFTLTGLDSFELSKYYGYGDRIQYPHNFILEAYLYYGFVGFMLTVLVLMMAFFSAKNLEQACLLSLVTVFCLLSGDFGDNYIVFSFCFGLILNRIERDEAKKISA
tara:strand:+ start:825 stop:1865 length:1041 start_codon:yes stop_codon:yes gene_type:complete